MVEQKVVFQFDDPAGERLDHFLVSQMPEYTRSRLQAFIRGGQVRVDGQVAGKSGQRLEGPAEVEVHIPAPAPSLLVPEKIPLDILYENAQVVVVNKPAGMVVHPSAGHPRGTLVQALLAHAPEMAGVGGEVRPGVIHRLDKNTSGVIVLAKTDTAHQFIQAQFKARTVEKWYQALVDGRPPTPEGRIETPIGRDLRDRQRMAVTVPEKGRAAVTEYHTLEDFPQHTLLAVRILTGRTHQIRVHLAFLKTPVVGDGVYGLRKTSLPLKRQFLHAWKLTAHLPGMETPQTFEAPLPPDLTHVLTNLRK